MRQADHIARQVIKRLNNESRKVKHTATKEVFPLPTLTDDLDDRPHHLVSPTSSWGSFSTNYGSKEFVEGFAFTKSPFERQTTKSKVIKGSRKATPSKIIERPKRG